MSEGHRPSPTRHTLSDGDIHEIHYVNETRNLQEHEKGQALFCECGQPATTIWGQDQASIGEEDGKRVWRCYIYRWAYCETCGLRWARYMFGERAVEEARLRRQEVQNANAPWRAHIGAEPHIHAWDRPSYRGNRCEGDCPWRYTSPPGASYRIEVRPITREEWEARQELRDGCIGGCTFEGCRCLSARYRCGCHEVISRRSYDMPMGPGASRSWRGSTIE